MMYRKGILATALLSAIVSLLLAVSVASAHVTIDPRESTPGAFQRYIVRVPVEKESPTVKVRVEIPDGVTVSSFQPKAGWTREVERDDQQRITAVTWSGGTIGAGEFDEFALVARNPAEPAALEWKAYQTYEDGETVEWVGPAGSDHPAAMVQVQAADAAPATGGVSATTAPAGGDASSATTTSGGSDLTLLAAVGALVLSIISLILAIAALARRPARVTA